MDEMNNKIAMIKCNKCLMTDRERRALGTQGKKYPSGWEVMGRTHGEDDINH